MVSTNCAVAPAELVAVQVHVDGLPTQLEEAVPDWGPCSAMAPLDVKPVPLAVQTRLTETALVLDHDKVYPAFAVIVAGERETLIVGAADGAMVVMVSERCAVAPPAFVGERQLSWPVMLPHQGMLL